MGEKLRLIIHIVPVKVKISLVRRYNIMFLVLTYVVPVTTMIAAYSRMSLVLWRSHCIGEFTEHQFNALLNKQKVSICHTTSPFLSMGGINQPPHCRRLISRFHLILNTPTFVCQ